MGNLYPLPQPEGVTQFGKVTVAPSSFGLSNTTLGEFSASSFVSSERFRELEYKEKFFKCAQHDHKTFDFNGCMRKAGPVSSQPFLATAQSPHYIPLSQRRPSSPYHIARLIVQSFTGLLLGYGHFPSIEDSDPVTKDFAEAIAKECKLESTMILARNIGGSVGTVGLAWKFVDGKPRITVHNGKHLYVHEWEDRDDLVPAHVSEIYQFPRDVFDREKKAVVRKLFWYRRDWTPVADVYFAECEVGEEDPAWEIDEEKSCIHNDGFCHFIWIQNLPEEATNCDGEPDYAHLYENCDSIDTLNSVTVRGGINNLDPTLKIKMNRELIKHHGIKKGSDNALIVGETGDASYMELSGSSMAAGINLFDNQRKALLEVAQCVVPDPDTITAAGTSSVALKIVFGPMLSKCSVLRTQYGTAIERVLSQMVRSAQKLYGSNEVEVDFVPDEAGNLYEEERPVQYFLKLPPRIIEEPVLDENGTPTGEMTVGMVEREPGNGGDIHVKWSDYFEATNNDNQTKVQTVSVATGGKPILSRRSAVHIVSGVYGLNPDKEFELVQAEDAAMVQAQAAMFPTVGAEGVEPVTGEEVSPEALVDEPDTEEAAPADTSTPGIADIEIEQSGTLKLTATDLASIVTVNEGRKSIGLDILRLADGSPDPDGVLTIEEFRSKRKAMGESLGDAEGTAEAAQDGLMPAPSIIAPSQPMPPNNPPAKPPVGTP